MTMMLERFTKNSFNFIAKSIYMIINNKTVFRRVTFWNKRHAQKEYVDIQ